MFPCFSYIFDEPSSYLDVKQRLRAARVIRDMATDGKYVIVVEHDLAVLDYLSDYICCLYGKPGAYGVVTLPSKVREGECRSVSRLCYRRFTLLFYHAFSRHTSATLLP